MRNKVVSFFFSNSPYGGLRLLLLSTPKYNRNNLYANCTYYRKLSCRAVKNVRQLALPVVLRLKVEMERGDKEDVDDVGDGR